MEKYTKIFLTGATGFLGRALLNQLLGLDKFKISIALRFHSVSSFLGCRVYAVGDFSKKIDLADILYDQDVLIHAAARTNIMKCKVADPLAEYRRVNVEGTLNLARQAAAAGVRRFIFISSIKVNGESTALERPFRASDMPAPEDPYGQSKLEAEQKLLQLAEATSMEVVIIRPPLIYGRGVKGNFASMINLVEKGVLLPLGAIHNKRSLVGIDNLVDLIIHCIDHPAASNRILLAGDGEDMSTTELLRAVGKAIGKPARLISMPAASLQWGAALLGKRAMAQRLLGSLQVDISQTCELLDWKPPYTVEEGLQRCFLPVD